MVNRSFITLLWWCRSTGTFLYKKKDGKTNAPFPVSKTVLHVSFLSTLTDTKSKLEITINHSGFFFYHSSGCIPIELYINQYIYVWVYEKTFEFLQVYKDIEFMNANQKKTNSFNKSYRSIHIKPVLRSEWRHPFCKIIKCFWKNDMKSGQNPRLHNILWQKCKHVRQTKKSLFIGEENYCPLMKNAWKRKCYTF